MADDNTTGLSDEHAQFLRNQAVDPELAVRLGVRSLLTRADNPQEGVWTNWANHPAILFPWVSPDGRTEIQVRPDNPTEDQRGRTRKYVFSKDMKPLLWAVKVVPDPRVVVIVEGTKQCLSAASYAPEDVSVYGMAGCRSWQHEGMPIPDLHVTDGRNVIVILDADAAENPEVYRAGNEMAAALAMEGAASIKFSRLPSAGKSGLDDILAGREPERRAAYFQRLLDNAKPKPADKAPAGRRKDQGEPGEEGDRPLVICNDDRFEVINSLTGALLERWNGVELFCHGGVLSRRNGQSMHPVDKGTFNDVVQSTVRTMNRNEGANGTTYSFAWPDPGTMAASLSRAAHFAPLDRITRAPFVRDDGSVATEPGYDEATRTMLVPDPVFEGLTVPETPSAEQIIAARQLIMEEWLGDFPFDTDADRANAMAMVLTPAIRGLVPKVPMAVIDGLQMGVGKNLMADSLLTVFTGEAARPMNWVDEADEVRKQITSAFRTGAEFFVFDEAHTLQGAPLAQALTASTWQDRILGVSTMAEFPNRVTWISLGNQVQVKGDITRRVYRIALRPGYANPQDRKASSFRHPGTSGLDLGSWTRKHRRELMTAILTLVRAWFAAGSPYPKRGVSFGSFEAWEKIVGGILETAGMPGFLENLRVWRSESDFDGQYWTAHLAWLREQFGGRAFRTAEVREKALAGGTDQYAAPPKLDDPTEKAYGKSLGEGYSRMRGRRMGTLWLERVSSAHGHVSLWCVHDESELPPPPGEPEPPADPDPVPPPPPVNRTGRGSVEVTGDIEGDSGLSTPDPQPVDNPGEGRVIQIGGVTAEWSKTIPLTEVSPEAFEIVTGYPRRVLEPAEVVTFDLETGDASDLYKADPQTYIRMGGTAIDDQPVKAFIDNPGWNVTVDVLRARMDATVTGHNIMAFDLPALVRARQLSMLDVHEMAAEGRLFDAMIVARHLDPPMARDKGVDASRKYDLGTLGAAYGLGEKLKDTAKELARKYGGWGEIPIDTSDADPERAADAEAFQRYMIQDVELSRRLHAALLEKLGGTVPEYVVREHRVAAVAAQISTNGFLVDQDLLAVRIAEIDERKSRSLEWLAAEHGLPLANGKGEPYKSPLASKAGKEAIGAALVAAGVPEKSLWRTEKSGDLQMSGEAMVHYGREYHDRPAVREIAKAVYRVVGARTVYETIHNHLCPDGRVHPKISFAQATGRWSLTEPGLTVLGKRGGRVVERAVFLPDPGEVIISADLSQVDMRAVAGLSGDRAYIEMLKAEDPHAEIAEALFGDRSKREIAKPIGHGWNYGRSLKAISESGDIDPKLVVEFDRQMRARFGRLVEWRDEMRELAASGALLDNGFGRKMRPDPLRAHTQAPALLGQGAARDIMMTGLLRLPPEILPMLRAQIHDEIVLSVPEGEAEEIGRVVVEALSFEWRGVPIMADVSKPGQTWAAAYAK